MTVARPVRVHKFGGTSVATADRIRRVVQLVQAEPETARRVVVVSALGGVTDQLLGCIDAALARTGAHRTTIEALRQRHQEVLEALVLPEERTALEAQLNAHWQALTELLDGLYLLRECTPRTRDAIISFGERLSAPLVAAAFRAAGSEAIALEATELIRTDDTFGEANVDFVTTNRLIRERFAAIPEDQIVVVTGFIGSTPEGVTTTLGRSGSDYTATILGAALDAELVVIWTDVDGVMSADPRLVPEAFVLPHLSYREAAEMAYFGAKVLHPRTMEPLQAKGIPLRIRNTLNPAAPGTLITAEAPPPPWYVRAVTAIRDVAVLMLEGSGMLGAPGLTGRAFQALAEHKINVLLVSQASSEQSLCLGVRAADAETALDVLRRTFAFELETGRIRRIYLVPECATVSVVGDRMRHQPGLAGRMFSALGQANVNVLAIAQGAAETNISAVIAQRDAQRAVQALHETFILRTMRAHLFLIGTGVIGGTLLDMLARQIPQLKEEEGLELRLAGLATAERMLWQPAGIPWNEARERLRAEGEPMDLDRLVQLLTTERPRRLVVVDATASEAVARRYPDLLTAGVAVVTPNKRANTLSYEFYRRLREIARERRVPYRYETTVGAGLPVIATLQDLLLAGDSVRRIEGVFSGTLAYLFNQMAEGVPFSEAVRAARAAGYTEPDPRDDLSGEDVARKLLILAREAGLPVERSDVEVQPLVPDELREVPLEEFLARLCEQDAYWRERVEEARREGRRLHYIGRIEDGRLAVGVQAVGPDSPFYNLQGTDNLIAFTTAYYCRTPLVVRGPGAGPEVTAAGIVSDLRRALEQMR
ncbi:bifunctional aspartate kinase/homoserine dehydrogenase I [Rhodothermus marinus]|uniref:bifunctional aspartate kinase/homoserine dehydrogenase I n=1 Tax=Rhodothermus marinus TaxID=29549 RepID=UPI0012BA3975|nr:bifunctional aspartate kinase/homoserine dehydrogenase I [Rhodothermus marinus]BBM73522.1 bifunctional aspartate kinase/homoserine dehydrogenase I [Rhodothermus marinus]